jgi:hypothetical protein
MGTRLKTTLDPNLYTQIGLDSGALSMLGTIVHQVKEAGQYRGALHVGPEVKAVFTVSADDDSPAAQATVDLARLEGVPTAATPAADGGCCGGGEANASPSGQRYTVNPRGYLLFHVSGGAGGYYVHLRRVDAADDDKGYDTRTLRGGDLFTAMILRPGRYSIVNALAQSRTEAVVHYPRVGDKAYVPAAPVRVECTAKGLEHPGRLELGVGQGLIFHAQVPARIEIRLEKVDDGPERTVRKRSGYRKGDRL